MTPAFRLLCLLGLHDAADPDGVWNSGYCFGRCRRCGRDVVRSVLGKWRVPKGYRVVWLAPDESPVPTGGVPVLPQGWNAPGRAVAEETDFMETPEDDAVWGVPLRVDAGRRSIDPDFMADASGQGEARRSA